jgi:hypothetical protein
MFVSNANNERVTPHEISGYCRQIELLCKFTSY